MNSNNLSGVTFVTCYVHIYENEPFQHKNVPWRLEQFEYIAALGVNICLYGDEVTTPFLTECIAKYPNVRLLDMDTPYKETPIYKMCLDPELTLPERRYHAKDTVEYMALMNAKIEFVHDAVTKNPFGSRIFSWMDFSMAYIFGNKGDSLPYLKQLTEKPFIDDFFAVPGCWEPIPPDNCSAIVNNIHWRFCGTFFIGDIESMKKFHAIYREKFPVFLYEQKKLVWEVNIWAWLESNSDWNGKWYASDHNDRIMRMPDHFFDLPELVIEPAPELVIESAPEPVIEPAPEPVIESAPEPVIESAPELVIESAPEPVIEPAPEPVIEPAPEPVIESAPEPLIEENSNT